MPDEDQKKIRELLEKQEAREQAKEKAKERASKIFVWIVGIPMMLLVGTCVAVMMSDGDDDAADVAAAPDECRDRGRVFVSREEFGDRWPLTVERGEVWCVDCLAAIFRDPETNTLYGLNGIADSRGAEDIRPIWRDNPSGETPKISLGVLTNVAFAVCK